MGLSFGDVIFIIVLISGISSVRCQFFECHDDPTRDPEDGALTDLQFTWLGLLQYIHVKNATPHYFRVPRVILISRQFVLSTAMDAAELPDGYALGNVVFGDYERDEKECGVTIDDLAHGADCDPAILLMPIADVLLHPEYKHFGAKDSVAIMKLITPVKSYYVVPACLPFKNYIILRTSKNIPEKLFHVDFISDVPRDFINEEKEVVKLSLLPRELCYLYDNPDNGTFLMKNRKACTTGCNFHSGAPTLVHEHTGHWSIVAISEGLWHPWVTIDMHIIFEEEKARKRTPGSEAAQLRMQPGTRLDGEEELIEKVLKLLKRTISGNTYLDIHDVVLGGSPCPDPLRPRRPPAPPRHILLFPYVPWITAAITGKAVGAFAKDDPFGYIMPRASIHDVGHDWVGHWWMGGLRCFDRGDASLDMFKFYYEIFQVKPTTPTYLAYYLEVFSSHNSMIICAKVGMPFRLGKPRVWDLDTPVAKVRIPTVTFIAMYRFHVEMWGYNTTESSTSEESSTSTEETMEGESQEE